MGSLREAAAAPDTRQALLSDAVKALDAEVASKGGLGGAAIKTAYKMVKGLAPDMVSRLLNNLLDDFLDAVQPFYDDAKGQGGDVAGQMASRKSEVAEALLSVTDARAERKSGGTLKKGYARLRPSALKHVEVGVPRLVEVVTKHVG